MGGVVQVACRTLYVLSLRGTSTIIAYIAWSSILGVMICI